MKSFALCIAILIPTLSIGQIKINADTLLNNCGYKGSSTANEIIFDSQEKYNEVEFQDSFNQPCAPFTGIDFNRSLLAGYRYGGSNCDTGIHSSEVKKTKTGYLIQFSIEGRHVCRDIAQRIAWFLVDKPPGNYDIRFELVDKKPSSDN